MIFQILIFLFALGFFGYIKGLFHSITGKNLLVYGLFIFLGFITTFYTLKHLNVITPYFGISNETSKNFQLTFSDLITDNPVKELNDKDTTFRLLTLSEFSFYIKSAFMEETLKLLIGISLFLIYILFFKPISDSKKYGKLFVFSILISTASFFFIENLLYLNANGSFSLLIFRSINSIHFALPIILILILQSGKKITIKFFVFSFIASVLLHFGYNSIAKMNLCFLSLIFILLNCYIFYSILYSEIENNVIPAYKYT